MNPRVVLFVFVASLAVACRSEGEKSTPAAETAAAPAKAPDSVPMAPLIAGPAGPAQQPAEPAPAKNDPRAQRLAAVTKEYDEAMQAYYDAIDKALGGNQDPTAEQWREVEAKVKQPDTQAFIARAQQLLTEDATDIAAFKTIKWLLDHAPDPESRRANLALLEKHHMNRPEMGDMCERLTRDGRGLVEKLLASSPHRDVRGRACFAMAGALKSDIDFAAELKSSSPEDLEGLKSYLGAERVAALEQLDTARTQKELERYYERTVSEFGDVKVGAGTKRETTLAKRAGSALFEMRELVVGKPAPEIEGKDLDSVAFKLSDYRGKVVLLDFWGNW